MDFRWIEWNLDKVAKHGVAPEEAELVVRAARRPYPLTLGDGRWLAIGRGRGGRYLQTAFLIDPDGTIFIIHSRPLTDREKRRYRRKRS